MNIEKKKEISTLWRTTRISKKKLRIPTPSKRILSIFVFVVIAIYTVMTKLVFSKNGKTLFSSGNIFTFDNLMMLAVIVNLVIVLIITIFGHSIYSLNHYRLFRRLQAISSICKVIIFISAISTAIINLNEVTKEQYGIEYGQYLIGRITHPKETPSMLVNEGVIDTINTMKFSALVIAIISLVPVIIFFFKNYGMYVVLYYSIFLGGLFALPFLIYLNSRFFSTYRYDPEDENFVIQESYHLPFKWWHWVLIVLLEIAIIVGIVFGIKAIINSFAK